MPLSQVKPTPPLGGTACIKNKTMNKFFLLAFALCALVACKQDGLSDANNNLKFDRVDLSGAEYLTVLNGGAVGKSTDGSSGLFKIDKDGNMTAVACYFTYGTDENGNKVSQEVRTDVKVVPLRIDRLGNGEYLRFLGCMFFDTQGEQIFANRLPSYLIRTKDGAVFDLSGVSLNGAQDEYSAQVDAEGNLYFTGGTNSGDTFSLGHVYKMEPQGDKMLVRELTNAQLGQFDGFVLTDKPNTFIAGQKEKGSSSSVAYNGALDGKWYVFYANGGFEPIATTATTDNSQHLFHVGNKIKILEQKRGVGEQLYINTLSIHSLDIQATPPYNLNTPTSSKIVGHDWWMESHPLTEVIECKSHYVLDCYQKLLVCSYADDSIIGVVENFTHFPYTYDYGKHKSDANSLGNIRFTIDFGSKMIKKFDFETLTYAEISYDASQIGDFVSTQKPIFSVADKTYTVYGVRNSDGRSIVAQINIETGAVQVNVNADNRTITELIKLN